MTDFEQLAKSILTRSAKLAAALIAGVYMYSRTYLNGGKYVVTIDGSLFTGNNAYQNILKATLDHLCPKDIKLIIEASQGEPLIGSGIVIATTN